MNWTRQRKPRPSLCEHGRTYILKGCIFFMRHMRKKRYCSKREGKRRSSLVRVVPLPGVCVRTSGESGCSIPISSGERFRIGQGILKANLHSLFSNRTARPQPFLLKRRMTCLREMEIDRAGGQAAVNETATAGKSFRKWASCFRSGPDGNVSRDAQEASAR